ncbi:tautomerase family protein [Microvirga terrestris]|uniref:Tautomerase family protein n=1 Tax=Microvirga terrestris TaxID=2791024 RepID=A0ABS0HWY3_9HYPH|nr:tautomerase family protein [Microvirga terrestris]MBF9197969.1 tautomerase family protein [Microvirga terrestris]
MPLIRISLQKGKPAAYRKALANGVYLALREAFNVPEGDLFVTISEHEEGNFFYGANYLDIQRSDDLVIIQITVSNTRTVEQKKTLFKRIVEKLETEPGLRPEDVFINLIEVEKENWSFGHGIAQYAQGN